jgi:GDPmannose 4,6-dehydratase
METKKALITGITGQDGSYLAELLLSKGYEVHGIVRRSSTSNTSRIDTFKNDLHLHFGDIADNDTITPLMCNVKPDEVYNLAAQSHVGVSFEMPEYTSNITALGTTRLLEAIRKNNPDARFYQASSSEMFGAAAPPQNENTPFAPQSPYACSKLYSYWMVRNFRDGHNTFGVNGILFNHESPRRGEIFVTRKITMGIAAILAKKEKYITLGNLDAKRDWGFSPEYVEIMWKMLQQKKPSDYVIGTGLTNTVQDFLNYSFEYAGLNKKHHLKSDKTLFRPTDVRVLKSDASYAKKTIGWSAKVTFKDLAKIMVDADMRKAGLEAIGEGDNIIAKKFPNRWWIND